MRTNKLIVLKYLTLVIAFLLMGMYLSGCSDEAAPTDASNENQSGVLSKKEKVDVCHNGNIINVSISSVPAHQAHGDAVDLDGDGYFGTWQGIGTDTFGGSYDMELNLACDFSSGIVDYVYDGGSCTGTLTLVSQTGNSYTYSETVTSGCIDNCTVVIELLEDGTIDFFEGCPGNIGLSADLSLN